MWKNLIRRRLFWAKDPNGTWVNVAFLPHPRGSTFSHFIGSVGISQVSAQGPNPSVHPQVVCGYEDAGLYSINHSFAELIRALNVLKQTSTSKRRRWRRTAVPPTHLASETFSRAAEQLSSRTPRTPDNDGIGGGFADPETADRKGWVVHPWPGLLQTQVRHQAQDSPMSATQFSASFITVSLRVSHGPVSLCDVSCMSV